ncbi:MAG: class I SAM-dependent methyltransferase [Pseudomonadota bacterium]
MRLTAQAHTHVSQHLRPGDLAVDATAGNGHDTLFLARMVGDTGTVIAMDVQTAALKATRQRLNEHGLQHCVELINACHSTLADHLPTDRPVNAAMFNLGYLPGSDKQATTHSSTTIAAVRVCLERLADNGVLSVMAYRGHAGGQREADDIAQLLGALPSSEFLREQHRAAGSGPVLWLATRRPRDRR